jgi:hypothetical protein
MVKAIFLMSQYQPKREGNNMEWRNGMGVYRFLNSVFETD